MFLKIICFSIFCLTNVLQINCYKNALNETFSCAIVNTSRDETQLCSYHYDEDCLRQRIPDWPIHPIIISRRSLHEMTGEPFTDDEMYTLLEAMRWGPSNYNNQPWRVVYARRGTRRFDEFLTLLLPGNEKWAKDSSILMILITDMYNRYKGRKEYMSTNTFASGAAFMMMNVEGSARGYVVHAFGAHRDRVKKLLGIDGNNDFTVELMIALGKRPAPTERGKGVIKDKMTMRRPINDWTARHEFNRIWLL